MRELIFVHHKRPGMIKGILSFLLDNLTKLYGTKVHFIGIETSNLIFGFITNEKPKKLENMIEKYEIHRDQVLALSDYYDDSINMIDNWKVDALSHDFAVMKIDGKNKKVEAYVDKFLRKKIYYKIDNEITVLSTSLKIVLVVLNKFTIRKETFAELIALDTIFAPNTIVHAVKKLNGGERLYVDLGKEMPHAFTSKYFNLREILQPLDRLNIDKTYDLLMDSVRVNKNDRKNYDLGIMFSGGTDSAMIAAVLTKIYPRQKIRGFTVHIPGYSESDVELARELAEFLGIQHDVVYGKELLDPEKLIKIINRSGRFLDEPTGGTAQMARWIGFAGIRNYKEVKYIYVGDEGGEIFSGARFDFLKAFRGNKKVGAIFSAIYRLNSEVIGLALNVIGDLSYRIIKKGAVSLKEKKLPILGVKITDIIDFLRSTDFIKAKNMTQLIFSTYQFDTKRNLSIKLGENILNVHLLRYFEKMYNEFYSRKKDTINAYTYTTLFLCAHNDLLIGYNYTNTINKRLLVPFLYDPFVFYVLSIPSKYKFSPRKSRLLQKKIIKEKNLLPPWYFRKYKKKGLRQAFVTDALFNTVKFHLIELTKVLESLPNQIREYIIEALRKMSYKDITISTSQYIKFSTILSFVSWFYSLAENLDIDGVKSK